MTGDIPYIASILFTRVKYYVTVEILLPSVSNNRTAEIILKMKSFMFLMTVKFYEVLLIARFEDKHSFSCLISHKMLTS